MARTLFSLVAALALGASPARADRSFEVTADSTLNSEVGTLVRLVTDGEVGQTAFAFEDPVSDPSSLIRIYAGRPDDTGMWGVLVGRQYLCPTFSMAPAQSWRFLDGDADEERRAEVIGLESVTVPAGTFSAWRVDITGVDLPGVVQSSFWFSGNVGLVREVDWNGPVIERSWDLASYQVTGLGFFPLEIGNRWEYTQSVVSARSRSVGLVKGRFTN